MDLKGDGFIETNIIYNEDCIGKNGMCRIPDKSIDMILCDLPYGTTACKWDIIIPFDKLWEQYNRIIKDSGAILLFGIEPFSSYLRISNIKSYRYDWVWEKDRHANFLFANKQPLKKHENISVFYKKQPTYNPQMVKGKPNHKMFFDDKENEIQYKEIMNQEVNLKQNKQDGLKYPSTVQFFKCLSRGVNIHPTQKPVELLEYLIRTYTNEGEIVLDNCMGSGSTAIACINTNRQYIGFEKDNKYYDIAVNRIKEHKFNKQ